MILNKKVYFLFLIISIFILKFNLQAQEAKNIVAWHYNLKNRNYLKVDTFYNSNIQIFDQSINKKVIDSLIYLIESKNKYFIWPKGDSLNTKLFPRENDSILIMNDSNFCIFEVNNYDIVFLGRRRNKLNNSFVFTYKFGIDKIGEWNEDKSNYFYYSKEYGVFGKAKIISFGDIIHYWAKKINGVNMKYEIGKITATE